MINLELDLVQAASLRAALFREQKEYTYDESCVPVRIKGIRDVVEQLDELIEKEIPQDETTDA